MFSSLSLTKLMSLMVIILCSLMMLFISNLLLKWIIYEISSISMVVYMNLENNNKLNSLMYFIVTVVSGVTFISLLLIGDFSYFFKFEYNSFILAFIFLKMGMFPFINWLLNIYKTMLWDEIFVMSTFMKFIPVCFLTNLVFVNEYILMFLLFNSLISSILMKFYLHSMKLFIGISSVNQSSFMVIMGFLDIYMFIFYFLFYSMALYKLICMMDMFKINKMFNMMETGILLKYNLLIMSLVFLYSGFPPFGLFMIKWMMNLAFMEGNKMLFLFMFMFMISSVLISWNYMNLIVPLVLIKKSSVKLVIFYGSPNFMFFLLYSISMFMFLAYEIFSMI